MSSSNVSIRGNLHEMSYPVSEKNKKNIIFSSAESAQRVIKVKSSNHSSRRHSDISLLL